MLAFNPTEFKLDYPVFNSLSDSYLTKTFDFKVMIIGRPIWGLFAANSGFEYAWACTVLAHLLALSNGQDGQANGIGKVGITTSAAEGDVSGSFDYPTTPDSQWWFQTSYGAECYELLRLRGGATYWSQGSYNGYVTYGCYGYGYCYP